MEEHGGHEDLCGSGHQSECVVLLCVRCSSRELNLSKSNAFPAFYSSRLQQLQGLSRTRQVVPEWLGPIR
jgi:hypothetical protein